jgi:hypothetical protein
MAWLWDSFEEFQDYVRPVMVAEHDGPFRNAQSATLAEHHTRITKAVEELNRLRDELRGLGFDDWPPKDQDVTRAEAVNHLCQELVWYGEELILYHKRLAKTQGGGDFLHEKNLAERVHWDRYAASRRIFREIKKLLEATDALLASYHELASLDEEYLLIEDELPDSVRADFNTARDLLSVGVDEVCLLIAGRGLEGTLRHIAKDRSLTLEERGKEGPVAETAFYHLIEVFGRLRWRGTGAPLLDKDAVALLHYLRSIRNAGAHPVVTADRRRTSAREISKVTVDMATSLWQDATKSGARLVSTKVLKDWP